MKSGKRGGGLPVTAALSVGCEQKPDLGEDAGMFVRHPASGAALLAALDGCGGAGAARYAAAENWTGARIASRLCGRALCDWFERAYMPGMPGDALVSGMKDALDAALNRAKTQLSGGSAVRGSMIRTLPTTLSAALIEPSETGVRCVPVWAGDSRVYVLTTEGLWQTTEDDVQGEPDAQENLERDGVLSNVISASGSYTLRWREIALDAPCAVLAATDGCFSYFHSPIDFETLLLSTLLASDSPAAWEAALLEGMGRVASDDYTLELAVLGFSSFAEMKDAYRPWADRFMERYGAPAAEAGALGDRERLFALWQAYKPNYMK